MTRKQKFGIVPLSCCKVARKLGGIKCPICQRSVVNDGTWMDDTGRVRYLPEPYTIEDRPLWRHVQGLQQTATGYGGHLTSRHVVRLPDGSTRRVYIACYSNAGTAYVTFNGLLHVVKEN